MANIKFWSMLGKSISMNGEVYALELVDGEENVYVGEAPEKVVATLEAQGSGSRHSDAYLAPKDLIGPLLDDDDGDEGDDDGDEGDDDGDEGDALGDDNTLDVAGSEGSPVPPETTVPPELAPSPSPTTSPELAPTPPQQPSPELTPPLATVPEEGATGGPANPAPTPSPEVDKSPTPDSPVSTEGTVPKEETGPPPADLINPFPSEEQPSAEGSTSISPGSAKGKSKGEAPS